MSTGNCPSCGASIGMNVTECKYCGESIAVHQAAAPHVVQQVQAQPQYHYQPPHAYPPADGSYIVTKSKVTAGLLGIFLGALGIHKFYLGRPGLGVLYILFCWTYIPGIVGFIEGIIYLSSSEQNFQNKYGRRYR